MKIDKAILIQIMGFMLFYSLFLDNVFMILFLGFTFGTLFHLYCKKKENKL